jgi:hypothetical protein
LLDALEQALRARRPAQGGLIQSIGMLGRDRTRPYSGGPEKQKSRPLARTAFRIVSVLAGSLAIKDGSNR